MASLIIDTQNQSLVTEVSSLSFPKSSRLLTPGDFQHVFDNVCTKQSGRLSTILAARSQNSSSRLGLIVSKRNSKLAVRRNRFKRITRESFRFFTEEFDKLNENFDVIVLAKSPSNSVTSSLLRHELEQQWSKLIVKLQKLN